MFRIILYKLQPQGQSSRLVLSTNMYLVHEESKNKKLITVYFEEEIPVCYEISTHEDAYSSCEIRNSNEILVEFIKGTETD